MTGGRPKASIIAVKATSADGQHLGSLRQDKFVVSGRSMYLDAHLAESA